MAEQQADEGAGLGQWVTGPTKPTVALHQKSVHSGRKGWTAGRQERGHRHSIIPQGKLMESLSFLVLPKGSLRRL